MRYIEYNLSNFGLYYLYEPRLTFRTVRIHRLRIVFVGHRMGSPVFQRSAGARAAADVRDQVPAKAPGPADCGPDQVKRAVQTRPAPGVRPSAGMRQAGGPTPIGPTLRLGRGPRATVHRYVVRRPVRFRPYVPIGRQLFRQRRGTAERHGRVYARFRVPVQGDPTVWLPVATAY